MKIEKTLITPKLASQLLAHNDENRTYRPTWAEAFAQDMRDGKWTLTPQTIAIGKSKRVLDGQHRLNAVILSGKSVWMMVAYDVENEEDVFAHTDITHARSLKDITRLPTWEISVLRCFASGAAGTLRLTNDQTLAHADLLLPHIQSLHEFAPTQRPRTTLAAIRAGAVLHSLEGNGPWAFECYRALSLLKTEDMVPPVSALLRHLLQPQPRLPDIVMMVRAYRAFNEARAGVPSVAIKEPEIVAALMCRKLRLLWPRIYKDTTPLSGGEDRFLRLAKN